VAVKLKKLRKNLRERVRILPANQSRRKGKKRSGVGKRRCTRGGGVGRGGGGKGGYSREVNMA